MKLRLALCQSRTSLHQSLFIWQKGILFPSCATACLSCPPSNKRLSPEYIRNYKSGIHHYPSKSNARRYFFIQDSLTLLHEVSESAGLRQTITWLNSRIYLHLTSTLNFQSQRRFPPPPLSPPFFFFRQKRHIFR